MDATKDRRNSTSSELPEDTQQETLPLYQEFQLQDPDSDTDTDTVPPLTATPDEVRDYLASLLRKRHNLPEDQVRRVVSHWTLGTGRELRVYTAQMYLNIFGSEYGWTLYRDVRLELYRTAPKNWMLDGRVCEFARNASQLPTEHTDVVRQTDTLQSLGCLRVSPFRCLCCSITWTEKCCSP
jgi:hypothetical protein